MQKRERTGLEVTAWISLAVGLMLLLFETRSTGEALETLRFTISFNAVVISGAALAALAAGVLAVLHFESIKKMLKHR